MNNYFELKGAGVALITPFTKEGKIDFVTLSKLIDMHITCGSDFLCILGTTAETPTLSYEEKKKIKDFVVNKAYGHIPIMIGIGGNCTKNVVDEIKSIGLDGIDAILSVVPYYNKPTQEGIYQHYKAISNATELPIIMYNVPGRTGVNMSNETAIRLSLECENIIGYKAASGDIEEIASLIKNKPQKLKVYSGDDDLTIEIMKLGGDGVISVFGNAFPKELKSIVDCAMNKDFCRADTLNNNYRHLYKLLFTEGNPAGVKAMMHKLGLIGNNLRLPLIPVSKETQSMIDNAITNMYK